MKAYLVNFDLLTRVIAENEDLAIKEAIKHISKNVHDYLVQENVPEVKEDKEMPYSGKDDIYFTS